MKKTKKGKTFLKDYISRKEDKNVSMLLDPLYVINQDMSKKEIDNCHKYFSQESYVCHVLSKKVDFKNSSAKKSIKNFVKKQ